jgi:hypothetical protein
VQRTEDLPVHALTDRLLQQVVLHQLAHSNI